MIGLHRSDIHKGLDGEELRNIISEYYNKLPMRSLAKNSDLFKCLKENEENIELAESLMTMNDIKNYFKELKLHFGANIEELLNKLNNYYSEDKISYYKFLDVNSLFEIISKFTKDNEECKQIICINKLMECMNWKAFLTFPNYDSHTESNLYFIGTEDEYNEWKVNY